ncbi:VOC family protein [Mycobacterium sp. 1245852.3]|uniref:VOC family protein n=1 Tax=Mycobacterium sp. 1245852.3 TaxID=1856860 RepID=UPI0018D31FDE|nr:VOC family protein [Mycobacterium sp. 1245852.3]
MAYLVEELDSAILAWVEQFGTGPWFRLAGFKGADATYRGTPSEAAITLAMAFSGNICIELIQPDDDQPSIWREHIERYGYGFHHFGKLTTAYDAEIKRYNEDDRELVFEAGAPTGSRLGFIDTTGIVPGYTELIEVDDATTTMFGNFRAASLDWNGDAPIRNFA